MSDTNGSQVSLLFYSRGKNPINDPHGFEILRRNNKYVIPLDLYLQENALTINSINFFKVILQISFFFIMYINNERSCIKLIIYNIT